jgi:hypothetical protein
VYNHMYVASFKIVLLYSEYILGISWSGILFFSAIPACKQTFHFVEHDFTLISFYEMKTFHVGYSVLLVLACLTKIKLGCRDIA